MYNVIYLLWLPIKEHIEFNTIKLVHKALHSELCAKQLLVKLAERRKNLSSSEQELKIKHREKNILEQQATIYSELPDSKK